MNQRLDRYLLLVVAGISLYWVGRFFDRGMGVIDEGFVAALSMRIVNGELPYKDFFTLLIPGVFLLHAGLYEVFGPSLWIGRCVLLVVATGIPVLVYLIARKRLSPWASAAAAGLSLIWGPHALEHINHANYNWMASFFALVALWLTGRWVHTGAPQAARAFNAPLLCIGLALGLSILFKQTIGGYAFIAIALFMLCFQSGWSRWRAWIWMCVGAFVVHIPVLVWLGWHGALPDMFRHILLIPLSDFSKGGAHPYPSMWPVWPGFPAINLDVSTTFLALMPWCYAVVALWWLFDFIRARLNSTLDSPEAQRKQAQEALILLYSGFAFLGNFPRADYGHLLYNMSAGYIVLMVLASRLHALLTRLAGTQVALGAVVLLGLFLARPLVEQGIRIPLWTLGARDTAWDHPRGGVKTSAHDAKVFTQVVGEMERIKKTGAQIFVLPNAPLLTFLADVPNPTRYDVLMPGNYERGTMQELQTLLAQGHIQWIVWRHRPMDNLVLADYEPEFAAFLKRHYQSVQRFDDYEFLTWRTTPSAAAP
ncbi:MAG: ArnT family glycosyltransferase [Burkholderiaceae bacterium]